MIIKLGWRVRGDEGIKIKDQKIERRFDTRWQREGEMTMITRKKKKMTGFSKSVWVDNECNLHLDYIRLCGHP